MEETKQKLEFSLQHAINRLNLIITLNEKKTDIITKLEASDKLEVADSNSLKERLQKIENIMQLLARRCWNNGYLEVAKKESSLKKRNWDIVGANKLDDIISKVINIIKNVKI